MRRKTNKRLVLAAIIALQAFYPATGFGATMGDLEAQLKRMQSELIKLQKQINEEKQARQALEDSVEIAMDESSDINTRIDKEMKVSGYADVEYIHDSRASENDKFRLHHVNLMFKKQFNDQLRFFSEIEYEDAPKFEATSPDDIEDAEGTIFLEAAYADYMLKPELILRGGRFLTPAGIWNEDHYTPFVPTQNRPAHIRSIFPQGIDGVMAHGTTKMDKLFVKYNVYLGNGEGNRGNNDANGHKAVGARATLVLPGVSNMELGASIYDDELNTGEEKTAYGVHAKARFGPVNIQGEYANGKMTPDGGSKYNKEGYYLQAGYNLREWMFGYRYDFYDSDDSANVDVETNSVFANYRVSPNFVMKLEYHDIAYDDPATEDYKQSILTGAYYFD